MSGHSPSAPTPAANRSQSALRFVILGIAAVILIFMVTSRWKEHEAAAEEEKKFAASHPAAGNAVAQVDTHKHKHQTPFNIDILGPVWIEPPGAKLEVDAPLKGGERHTFVFGADEKIDFTKEKDKDGKSYEVWIGEYKFATPDKPGLPVYITDK